MDNHYHVLIETIDSTLSQGMRQLNGVYTQSFNRRQNRSGHVFQGWYKAVLVQKDAHLLELCRYVVLNPVRAKMVEHPGDWIWGSYCATAFGNQPPDWLTTDWILGQFSTKRPVAQERYRSINSLNVIEGDLPARARKLVIEWAEKYQSELKTIWETQEFKKLPPLE